MASRRGERLALGSQQAKGVTEEKGTQKAEKTGACGFWRAGGESALPWDPQQAKGVTEELSFGGGD